MSWAVELMSLFANSVQFQIATKLKCVNVKAQYESLFYSSEGRKNIINYQNLKFKILKNEGV